MLQKAGRLRVSRRAAAGARQLDPHTSEALARRLGARFEVFGDDTDEAEVNEKNMRLDEAIVSARRAHAAAQR